eukprot:4310334-Lingulodinium_polyedra.AAC.1
MCNLASIEILVKRRMLIEAAYRGRPEQPNFSGSDHFMGYKDSDNGEFIDDAVIKYQAQRLHEESQILKEQRLEREEDAALRSKGGEGHGGPKK